MLVQSQQIPRARSNLVIDDSIVELVAMGEPATVST